MKCSLVPSSEEATTRERAVANTLLRLLEAGSEARLLDRYNGTQRTGPMQRPGTKWKMLLRATSALIEMGMRPDIYAAIASRGYVAGYLVELTASSITEHTVRRLVPRLLLYKAYADTCIGPRSTAFIATTSPPSPGEPFAALVSLESPAEASRLLQRLLQELAEAASSDTPPPPRHRPPCSECCYRRHCPHAQEV